MSKLSFVVTKYLLLISFFVITTGALARTSGLDDAPVLKDSIGHCFEPFELYLKLKADPSEIANRLQTKFINQSLPITLDIGGEGRYLNAINLNPQPFTTTTGKAYQYIPNWVPGNGSHIPFPSKSIDVIYLENAPLSLETLDQVSRVIKSGGKIHMSHPVEYIDNYIVTIEEYFGKRNIQFSNNNGIIDTDIIIP